ncbi:hypothetical protein [Streptomyces sp. TRM68367]|uniref:hypothetical protein n=1 Tax=Streptomyces sp. TRM68367 TaxID=2758415 RepID=UPI00165AC07B|nr:hypothetical protein [Streptomyces sp. TRM68367]MBC9730244.1 hypothetical protein [Streptomyces sp. TRM68367]
MTEGRRTSIAEMMANTKTGNELPPDKRTEQQATPKTEDDSSSRHRDQKTNRLPARPRLPQVSDAHSDFRPPQSSDPRERLTYCVDALRYANNQIEQALVWIERQWILWVAEPLRIVRDEELWRLDGYPTFDAWCQAHYGYSGDLANKQIRAKPIVEILAPYVRKQIKEYTIRPLRGVFDKHGPEKVLEVWHRAEQNGDLTEAGLKAAIVSLGLGGALGTADATVPASRQPVLRLKAGEPINQKVLTEWARAVPSNEARSAAYGILAAIGDVEQAPEIGDNPPSP